MIRRFLPLFLAAAAPAAADPLPLVDLTGEFGRFYDGSEGLDPAQRAAALKRHFAPLIPGFYSSERVTFTDYDALIGKALALYPEERSDIASVSQRFRSMLEPSRQTFEATFGPLEDVSPIYLLHSLGEMDGGTRTLNGTSHLIFGADVIAKMHGDHDVQPFFHHELFHVLHGRLFDDDCDRTWCGLWTEGLATAVAARLNAGATDAELLLSQPVSLRAAFEANQEEAVCLVLDRLDEKAAESGLFFGSRRPSETLPPRIGYYIGYLIADRAADTHDLEALADMKGMEVRPMIEATLRSMADCPAR